MANVNYTVVLDLTDNGCINTGWRLKQGDNGNSTIVVKIVDNGVDVYEPLSTPEIAFKRADGTSVLSTMTASDGYYNYTFVGNELAVAGPVVMDVTFTDEESRTSTASCRFEVVENPAGYDPEGAHTYDNPVSVLVGRATEDALIAEGFAVGQQRGQDVQESSPYYHNNAKYYSDLTDPTALRNMSDVDVEGVQNGQVLKWNSTTEKWENANESGGGASLPIDISDNTNNVTGILKITNGGTGNGSGYIRKGNRSGGSIGLYSTVEGNNNVASGGVSHAEGDGCSALGLISHAEGNGCMASGNFSHAEGQGTLAAANCQHAEGKWNAVDNNNTYAHIVGNGTDTDHRLNIHTLDWSGNAWFAGTVTDGTNNVLSAKANTTDVNNKHKVSNFEVSTTGWTADTTSQSGTTLYKKQVTLSHVYANPSVDIGASTGNVLPTTAEQEAYNLVQYVTVDDTVPCLYLYASDTPTSAFNIDVEGVD